MRTNLAITLFALTSCGGNNNQVPDAGDPVVIDAAVDAPPTVPAMIVVSGTATQRTVNGTAMAPDVSVAGYRASDETSAINSTMTATNGTYSLTLTINNTAVDGYLKATKTSDVTTYLYPPAPLSADMMNASLVMLDTQSYNVFKTIGGQANGRGMIALIVVDASGMPVSDATVSSTPAAGKTGYTANGGSDLPSTTATKTNTDGRAYLFDLPLGNVTVSAAKTGSTFASHAVNARADVFTMTLITP